MTLELLSGPHDIVDPDGNILTSTLGSGAQAWFYDSSLGLMGYDSSMGGYCVIQLDGKAYLRSDTTRNNKYSLDLQRPGEQLVHWSLFEDAISTFNKQAGTFGELLYSGATNSVLNILARASDRYLYVVNNTVQWRALDMSGAWVTEYTLTGYGSGVPTVSLSRRTGVLTLVYLDGHICLYDTINKVQVAYAANLGTNQGAWYSPKFGIFVALVSNKVKIFSSAVRPSSLSNPSAVTAIMQGRVSQVKVRVLGSNSEACVGEIVEWLITAGNGSLAHEQSVTDDEGYAVIEYRAPVLVTGTATIEASVQF